MRFIDDIAKKNHANWNKGGWLVDSPGTEPALGLEIEPFGAFADGRSDTLPDPFAAESTNPLVRNVAGKDVLCLAGGGGQQSVLFSLLGAKVTVLDLSEAQLARDQLAADHYGYQVSLVHGDMRDLSAFSDDSFDRVCQPIAICFVPNVRVVYGEVARVLRPGGLYQVAHCNPATYPTCFDGPNNGWDGVGYRIAEPYVCGPIKKKEDGSESMTEGEPTSEFRHSLSDIYNGLIECGLTIVRVQEDARHFDHKLPAVPGSDEHWIAHVAEYFWIVSRKPNASREGV